MRSPLLLTAAFALAAGQTLAQCPSGETEVTVHIVLDRYGSETTWSVTGPGGSPEFASGGPYTDASVNGEYPQPDVTFCVPDGTPLTLTVDDSYGDGICCAYGEGSIAVEAAGYDLLSIGAFGSTANGACVIGATELEAVKVNMYDYVGQGNQTITGEVRNLGTVPISSFTLDYAIDGGSPVSEVITAAVNPGSTYTFSCTNPWNASVGPHDVSINATLPNGAADLIATNNGRDHEVTVASAVTDRVTLVEEFTSSTCVPCAGFNEFFDPVLDDLQTNLPGSNVAAVKYQMNWPAPGNDPSYNPEGDTRKSYYGVNGIPSPWLDGRAMQYGTADELTGAAQAPAPVDIDLTATRDGNTVTVFATVTPYINATGTNKLHIAITEDYYSYPASTTTQDEFHFVQRKMLPNGQGTNLGTLEDGVAETFTYTYAMTEGGPAQGNFNLWGGIEGITVVAFVQQNSSKYVYQAAFAEAPVGLDENEKSQVRLFPNPTNGLLNIVLNANGLATVDVLNVLGERVLTNTFNANGLRTMDLSALDNGLYLVNVTTNGTTTTHKVTLSK